MIAITVDTRERDPRVATLLGARPDVRVVREQLPWGDFAIRRTIAVERKTADDFAASVINGRLFRQLTGIRKRYARPLLIIEGLRHGEALPSLPWRAVRGALLSVGAMFGVPVLHSSGVAESADIIVGAARMLTRATEDGYVRPGYRPTGWRRRALYILQGVPGIGPSRANALLDGFGSVRAVLQADPDALSRIDTIGPVTARRILLALGPQPPAVPLATGIAQSHDPRDPSGLFINNGGRGILTG